MLVKIGVDPVAFTVGLLRVHWYGIMIAIGLYAGIQVALRDAPRRGVNPDRLMNTALLAAALGIIGGRLYYVVQNHPESYLRRPQDILAVWQGGMAFYGAIFGGALAVVISAWLFHMSFWKVADLGALGLTIGQAFGRVGNIINGDIVGYPTDGKWGFVYTNPNTFGPRDVAVQPASLYELLISLALFVILWNLRKRLHPDGMLAMGYLILYSFSQLMVFQFRDNLVVFNGLKQAQVTAIVVMALTLPFIAYLLRKERLAPAVTAAEVPAEVETSIEPSGSEIQPPSSEPIS